MLPRHGKAPDFEAAVHEAPKPAGNFLPRGADLQDHCDDTLQENCDEELPENGKLPYLATVPQRADLQQNCDGVLPLHGMQPDFEAAVHEAPKPAMKPVLRGSNLQENCDDVLPENGKLPNFAAVPQRADIQQECDGVLPRHGKAPDLKAAVHEAPKPAGKLVPRELTCKQIAMKRCQDMVSQPTLKLQCRKHLSQLRNPSRRERQIWLKLRILVEHP